VGISPPSNLVRAFSGTLEIIIVREGAVVKTIGDAVMADFHQPENAIARAWTDSRGRWMRSTSKAGTHDLVVKIGIHERAHARLCIN